MSVAYTNRLKETRMIVSAIKIKATGTTISAALSILSERTSCFESHGQERKDTTDHEQDGCKACNIVNDAWRCRSLIFLIEVNTMRQNPSRLEEVLSIWGDFSWLILLLLCF